MELALQTVPLGGGVGFIYLFKLRQLLEEYNFFKKKPQYLFRDKAIYIKNTFFRVIAGIFSASPSAYFLRIQGTFTSV